MARTNYSGFGGQPPFLLPLSETLDRIDPCPKRVLLVRCAPEPLVRRGLEALRRAFPEAALTVLCQPGRELEGCACLVCPGQGFMRLEDLGPTELAALQCDLAVIPCSTTRRLCPSYHNINRLARASGAARIVHYYSDNLASALSGEELESLVHQAHAPFLERKRAVIAELAEYTGEDPAAVERRCDLAGLEAVELWRRDAPMDEAAVRRFYQQYDFYLYELMKTEYNGDEEELQQAVIARCRPGERVLEYGGGCGTLSIALAQRGCRVTHLDLPGRLLDFAAWRFRRRSLEISLQPLEREGELGGPYDTLVSVFVLEHLFDPENALRAMRHALAPGGRLLLAVDFEESPVKTEPLPLHLCRLGRTRYAELTAELGLRRYESCGALDVFEATGAPPAPD